MIDSTAYMQLRLWYLARLRKLSLATESEMKLTPAALISADKENIEKQILLERDATLDPTLRKSTLVLDVVLAIVLASGLVFAYVKIGGQPFDLTKTPDQLFVVLILLLVAESVLSNRRK